jgi:hypothetical protein
MIFDFCTDQYKMIFDFCTDQYKMIFDFCTDQYNSDFPNHAHVTDRYIRIVLISTIRIFRIMLMLLIGTSEITDFCTDQYNSDFPNHTHVTDRYIRNQKSRLFVLISTIRIFRIMLMLLIGTSEITAFSRQRLYNCEHKIAVIPWEQTKNECDRLRTKHVQSKIISLYGPWAMVARQ